MGEKILVVDDEKEIADLIEVYLKNDGYTVYKYYNGMDALQCIGETELDLAILDIMLPDIDGFCICQKIREKHFYPVIMLTAKVEDGDKIMGLTLGADDYITKPFGNSELLARIRTALRHSSQLGSGASAADRPYRSGGLTIDFEKHLVTRDGQEIHLTQNEFKIIALLARNSGKVLLYDRLIEHIWGPYSENDNTILRVNMANIRRKIEPNPAEPIYIFTEIGVGYRMAEEDPAP